MTTTEAAKAKGVTASTVARWCRLGLVDAYKQGRRWVIRSLNRVIRAVAKTVEVVREVIAPAEPRSLWSYRRVLHGF